MYPQGQMSYPILPPPRLIIGAALLFWGAITGNPVIGLILALFLEAANWIQTRWDFRSTAQSRSWRLSLALMVVVGVLIWIDGDHYSALPRLFIWLPLLLAPIQFVQSYGTSDRIALSAFSLFTSVYEKRNLRLGLPASLIHFNFGNIYLLVIFLSASLGKYADSRIFFVGILALVSWLLYARMKSRLLAICVLMAFAGIGSLAGQIGLKNLYEWASKRAIGDSFEQLGPSENRTNIGSLGELKQSPQMLWRLTPDPDSAPPRLLRTYVYNEYRGISWRSRGDDLREFKEEDFRDLTNIQIFGREPAFLIPDESSPADLGANFPSFSIRGASSTGATLPLPSNTSTAQNFALDGIEINPLGSVRIFPRKAIIDGSVRWRSRSISEATPNPRLDLSLSPAEEVVVRDIVKKLNLTALPTTSAKLNRISQYFRDNFSYTRYLSIQGNYATRPTPIEQFLTTNKSGHCEYFATAAALILRAAEIPARYCVGFVVAELDPKRNYFVIRGTHAHAWVRYWDRDASRWKDFDPTPGSWLEAESGGANSPGRFADYFQRLKEDFFIWRNRPRNRLGATVAMWSLGTCLLLFIASRLRKSRLRNKHTFHPQYQTGTPIRTPLHDIEHAATRILGPRPTGTTFGQWLYGLKRYPISDRVLEDTISLHQVIRFGASSKSQDFYDALSKNTVVLKKSLRKLTKGKSGS